MVSCVGGDDGDDGGGARWRKAEEDLVVTSRRDGKFVGDMKGGVLVWRRRTSTMAKFCQI